MAICKGCRAPVIFVERQGKMIPVEPEWVDCVPAERWETSFALMLETGQVLQRMRVRRPADDAPAWRGRILHHSRCPERERFSRKGKRGVKL